MNAENFASFVKSYVFTPGRRIVTAQTVLDVAEEVGDVELAVQARETIAFDREVWEAQRLWEREREVKEGTRVSLMEIDQQLDRTLVGMHSVADGHVYSLVPGDEQYDISAEFIEEFFPKGPGAITRLRYEDQLAAVESYLVRWKTVWKVRLDVLSLNKLVERAEVLTEAYRKGVSTVSKRGIVWDDVRAMDDLGQEHMLALIVRVCGLYNSRSVADVQMRGRYLATFFDQNERVKQIRKRTHVVADVDPDSGEEVVVPGPVGNVPEVSDNPEVVEN